MTTGWRHPDCVVTTGWLAENLENPDLRLFDCTAYLQIDTQTDRLIGNVSGREDWLAAHIPGAVHLDLQIDFSDKASPYRFMNLPPQEMADAFARHGVGEGTTAILYCRGTPQFATRFWWMLHSIGFDTASVLDGGMEKWLAERRPVASGEEAHPPASLKARPRDGLFVGRDEMLAAIDNPAACSVNALSAALHRGESPRYGRPGRIPGSVNVPVSDLIDPSTNCFRPAGEVAAAFARAGVTPDRRILNYCGGGIAASLDAFLQYRLGYENVAVYDASLSEWASDESLPMEIG